MGSKQFILPAIENCTTYPKTANVLLQFLVTNAVDDQVLLSPSEIKEHTGINIVPIRSYLKLFEKEGFLKRINDNSKRLITGVILNKDKLDLIKNRYLKILKNKKQNAELIKKLENLQGSVLSKSQFEILKKLIELQVDNKYLIKYGEIRKLTGYSRQLIHQSISMLTKYGFIKDRTKNTITLNFENIKHITSPKVIF